MATEHESTARRKRQASRMNAPASHAGSRTTWTRLSAARYGTGNRAISGPQGERQESGTLSSAVTSETPDNDR